MSASALMIGGQLIQGYGAYESGVQKEAMYRAEAAAKRAQAAQVEIAADHEIDLISRRAERVRGAQLSAFGRSGVQVNTGSPLLQMEATAADVADQIRAVRGAARYRKSSLLTEGMLSEQAGSSAYNQGMYGLFGAGLGAFAKNPYSYDQRTSYYGGPDRADNIAGVS